MNELDTGKCVQENIATLLIQQAEMLSGRRAVQMFPKGTSELLLPDGFLRFENERGVFHHHPDILSSQIDKLSKEGRENLFLRLGPFSKPAICERLENGERLLFITEYTPDGTEVRCAVGTDSTVEIQLDYFHKTKVAKNKLVVGVPPERVVAQLLKG